ncbi:MAG: hypothetical protein M3P47_02290 [Pseudomonadota bacterium]|nr:hypothetical protein [Pseudomonadota bacterium]
MEKNLQDTEAVHLQNGDQHVVGVKSLSVLLCEDGGAWFAQSLEIDYAAAGQSVEEAKDNFAAGLDATIAEHLKLYGSIDKFLKIAPQHAWDAFYAVDPSALKQKITTVQYHNINTLSDESSCFEKGVTFPFKEIKFLEPLAA